MDARVERVWTPQVDEQGVDAAEADNHALGEANAWVIGDDDEVIVIDPGRDAASVLEVVGERVVDGCADAVVRPGRPFRRHWPIQVAHAVPARAI